MRTFCSVCKGKGTVNDPKVGGPMSYCDMQGNTWPQMDCPNCAGSGQVGTPDSDLDFFREVGIKA